MYSSLAGMYSSLTDMHSSLAGPYSSLAGPYSSLAGPYSSLAGPYSSLDDMYNSQAVTSQHRSATDTKAETTQHCFVVNTVAWLSVLRPMQTVFCV